MYEKQLKKLHVSIGRLNNKLRLKVEQLKLLEIKRIISERKGQTFNIVQYRIEIPNSNISNAYCKDYFDTNLDILNIEETPIIENPDYVIIWESYTVPEYDNEQSYIIRAVPFKEFQEIDKKTHT